MEPVFHNGQWWSQDEQQNWFVWNEERQAWDAYASAPEGQVATEGTEAQAPAPVPIATDVAEAAELDDESNGQVLEKYQVIYRGGHPDYPKAKAGGIIMQLLPDRFVFKSTMGTKKWFQGLEIPYSDVRDVQIVDRVVSTFEGIVGGLDSRQLNQKNNIHIEYLQGQVPVVLRLEMLSGVSVMGQAAKCRQFEDRLQNLGIRAKFQGQAPMTSSAEPDVMDQLRKLGELRDAGVLSEEEFAEKKQVLLAKLT